MSHKIFDNKKRTKKITDNNGYRKINDNKKLYEKTKLL